ncbi:MAG: GNAT family N-acetyltransferase [Acidimicrobiia bacterium]
MAFEIRPVRVEDIESITAWTRDTFDWGDYVPSALPDWLADDTSLVMACVGEDDIPVAVSRAQMLTPSEAWLSGARVHPDHRRSGMGIAMNDHGVEWARQRGAKVVRLVTESGNEMARGQVEKSGYRQIGDWLYGVAEPAVGRHPRPDDRLRIAGSADADAAWMFWSQSDIARQGRDLMAGGWRWRKGRRGDLDEAIQARSFYGCRGGWVISHRVEGAMETVWIATTPTDTPLILLGLRHLARDQEIDQVRVFVPDSPWMAEALNREQFESRPVVIYSKALSAVR